MWWQTVATEGCCSDPPSVSNQTVAVTLETCVGSCSTQKIDQGSMWKSVELNLYEEYIMALKSILLVFNLHPLAWQMLEAQKHRSTTIYSCSNVKKSYNAAWEHSSICIQSQPSIFNSIQFSLMQLYLYNTFKITRLDQSALQSKKTTTPKAWSRNVSCTIKWYKR